VIRGVVFDFDGVIANSEPLHLRAFQEVLAEEGVPLSKHDYYARYLGFDDAGVFREVAADLGRTWNAEHVAALVLRKADRLETLERELSLLFPGARETIERLACSFPLAIASGALGHEIRRILDREELAACFKIIVAAEDTPAGKPAPDPYQLAVERLGVSTGLSLQPGECVAVEDSRWGLQSAKTAGLHTIAITHSYPAAELTGAELVIHHLSELIPCLTGTVGRNGLK
jgi:beta-phosphoglucomutase